MLFAAIAAVTIVGLMPPSLEVETLNGRAMTIPRDTPEAASIYVVTFDRDAASQAKEWTSQLRRAFASAPVYEVAVMEDTPALIRSFAVAGIRRSVPQAMRTSFLVVTKQSRDWKQISDYSAADDAYVLVASRKEILWRAHGRFAGEQLAAIRAVIAAK